MHSRLRARRSGQSKKASRKHTSLSFLKSLPARKANLATGPRQSPVETANELLSGSSSEEDTTPPAAAAGSAEAQAPQPTHEVAHTSGGVPLLMAAAAGDLQGVLAHLGSLSAPGTGQTRTRQGPGGPLAPLLARRLPGKACMLSAMAAIPLPPYPSITSTLLEMSPAPLQLSAPGCGPAHFAAASCAVWGRGPARPGALVELCGGNDRGGGGPASVTWSHMPSRAQQDAATAAAVMAALPHTSPGKHKRALTPLHVAAALLCHSAVEALVQSGVSASCLDVDGATPHVLAWLAWAATGASAQVREAAVGIWACPGPEPAQPHPLVGEVLRGLAQKGGMGAAEGAVSLEVRPASDWADAEGRRLPQGRHLLDRFASDSTCVSLLHLVAAFGSAEHMQALLDSLQCGPHQRQRVRAACAMLLANTPFDAQDTIASVYARQAASELSAGFPGVAALLMPGPVPCGDTPLHLAARMGNTGTLLCLLQHGLHPMLRNLEGHTVLQVAVQADVEACPALDELAAQCLQHTSVGRVWQHLTTLPRALWGTSTSLPEAVRARFPPAHALPVPESQHSASGGPGTRERVVGALLEADPELMDTSKPLASLDHGDVRAIVHACVLRARFQCLLQLGRAGMSLASLSEALPKRAPPSLSATAEHCACDISAPVADACSAACAAGLQEAVVGQLRQRLHILTPTLEERIRHAAQTGPVPDALVRQSLVNASLTAQVLAAAVALSETLSVHGQRGWLNLLLCDGRPAQATFSLEPEVERSALPVPSGWRQMLDPLQAPGETTQFWDCGILPHRPSGGSPCPYLQAAMRMAQSCAETAVGIPLRVPSVEGGLVCLHLASTGSLPTPAELALNMAACLDPSVWPTAQQAHALAGSSTATRCACILPFLDALCLASLWAWEDGVAALTQALMDRLPSTAQDGEGALPSTPEAYCALLPGMHTCGWQRALWGAGDEAGSLVLHLVQGIAAEFDAEGLDERCTALLRTAEEAAHAAAVEEQAAVPGTELVAKPVPVSTLLPPCIVRDAIAALISRQCQEEQDRVFRCCIATGALVFLPSDFRRTLPSISCLLNVDVPGLGGRRATRQIISAAQQMAVDSLLERPPAPASGAASGTGGSLIERLQGWFGAAKAGQSREDGCAPGASSTKGARDILHVWRQHAVLPVTKAWLDALARPCRARGSQESLPASASTLLPLLSLIRHPRLSNCLHALCSGCEGELASLALHGAALLYHALCVAGSDADSAPESADWRRVCVSPDDLLACLAVLRVLRSRTVPRGVQPFLAALLEACRDAAAQVAPVVSPHSIDSIQHCLPERISHQLAPDTVLWWILEPQDSEHACSEPCP